MIVLDASVWVSALRTSDSNHAVSHRWLAEWTGADKLIFVPRLFLAEIGGAIARTSGTPAVGPQAIADAESNPAIKVISIDDALVDRAGRLAADLLLRGADAVYVALAERMGIPLITWDNEQLTRAAKAIDVRVPTV